MKGFDTQNIFLKQMFVSFPRNIRCEAAAQGCQIFLGATYQNGEK
jgi:hypothetical protein